MANPGPPKTPTAILKLRDSWRADGRPDVEGVPTIAVEMPYRIKKHAFARKYWVKNYQFLSGLGLMSGASHIGFEELAMAYHLMRSAEVKMKGELMFVPSYAKAYRDHRTDYFKIAKQFGCTPSSQASIQLTVNQGSPATGKDRFFDKKFGSDTA